MVQLTTLVNQGAIAMIQVIEGKPVIDHTDFKVILYKAPKHIPLFRAYNGTKPPTESEWEEWLETGRNAEEEFGAFNLLVTGHSAPGRSQRAQAKDAFQRNPVGVVLSDNPILRGAMTAFGWMFESKRLKGFPLSAQGLKEAFNHYACFDRPIHPEVQHLVARDLDIEWKVAAA